MTDIASCVVHLKFKCDVFEDWDTYSKLVQSVYVLVWKDSTNVDTKVLKLIAKSTYAKYNYDLSKYVTNCSNKVDIDSMFIHVTDLRKLAERLNTLKDNLCKDTVCECVILATALVTEIGTKSLYRTLIRLCRYAAYIINDNRKDAEEKFIDTVVEIINKV